MIADVNLRLRDSYGKQDVDGCHVFKQANLVPRAQIAFNTLHDFDSPPTAVDRALGRRTSEGLQALASRQSSMQGRPGTGDKILLLTIP